MAELKPCPFCGGEAEYRKTRASFSNEDLSNHLIFCRNCDVKTAFYLTYEGVEAAWNTRTESEPKALTLEELREVQNNMTKPIWVKTLKYGQVVSVILDYDFKNKEIIAIWACRVQPYREKDYGKTWLAFDREPKKGIEERL